MEKKQGDRPEDDPRFWDSSPELPWRAWGSWFSWGSPVGLGLFLISIGIVLWLLHLANIIK